MPKNTRRVTVTRTVTFQATIDTVGRPEETDANMLTLLGGAAGSTGTLSIAELLAGSPSANGSVVRGNWSVTGTSANIEPYATRTPSLPMTVGQRIASLSPPSGSEAALGKLFVVTTAGTTGSSTTEPAWNLSNGGATTDGGVTFRTIPKFPTLNTFTTSTSYSQGAIVRPSANSLKEFLVTIGGTTAASAPTWTNADTPGQTIVSGTVTFTCIAGARTYAFNAVFALGEIVKPSAADTGEYIVTTAGTSDTTALSASVGSSVTRGSAVFKRIV